jgi:hypothetical protein
MLDLIEPVKSIINEVKELTNKDFEFIEKKDLPTYTMVKPARKGMPSHIILYRENRADLIFHLIAHECGHIRRMYMTPVEKRLIPATDNNTEELARNQISADLNQLKRKYPIGIVNEMWKSWFQGIIRLLTNYPTDIAIEKWLYNDYATLRPFQEKSLRKQYDEVKLGLSEEVKKLTPNKIYNTANTMNYVFFKIVSDHSGIDYISLFNTTEFKQKGQELVDFTIQNWVDNYEGDIRLINSWAEFLQLDGWFCWTDFEDIPAGYTQQT